MRLPRDGERCWRSCPRIDSGMWGRRLRNGFYGFLVVGYGVKGEGSGIRCCLDCGAEEIVECCGVCVVHVGTVGIPCDKRYSLIVVRANNCRLFNGQHSSQQS
jgi:hypothetical protein